MLLIDRESEAAAGTAGSTDFAHTGPGTLAGRFLRRFWQPVHRSIELKAGQAKPVRVMSEDFSLYRGESGTAYVVAPRCAHRGTQLSTGWIEGDCVRCFYHGWKYDGSGQCVEQPAEGSGFAAKVCVASYPTREHLGLIFAYLGEGQPPPFPPVPLFEGEGIVETFVEPFPCNFFQSWENNADEVHVSFVHSGGGTHRGIAELPDMSSEETDYGIVRRSRRTDGNVRVTLHLMPNVTRVVVPSFNGLEGGGWKDTYLFLVPIDDENHNFYGSQHVQVSGREAEAYREGYERYLQRLAHSRPSREVAADILAGKLTLADVADHPWLVMIEDEVAQAGQGRIFDGSAEHLGRTDVGIIHMRKIWARELRALAEGRPLKQWRYTGQHLPDKGF